MQFAFIIFYFAFILTPFLNGTQQNLIGELLQVQNVKITNAKWQTYDNGNPPVLLRYDVDITLSNDLHLKKTNVAPDQVPLSSFREGDIVIVRNTAFFYDNPSQSWYSLEHQHKRIVTNFFGNSLESPSYDYTEAYPIIGLHRLWGKTAKGTDGWLLKFSLKGYYFTVEDNLFTGLYQKGSLVVLSEKPSRDRDSNRVKISGFFKNSNKRFEFVSDPFTENNFIDNPNYVQVIEVKETGNQWIETKRYPPGYAYGYYIYYKVVRTMTVYTNNGNYKIQYSNTAEDYIPDYGEYAPLHENLDFEPKEHWEFISSLSIGQQLVILEDHQLFNPVTGKIVTCVID